MKRIIFLYREEMNTSKVNHFNWSVHTGQEYSGRDFKRFSPGILLKVVARNNTHNGFSYQVGLNRDTKPFQPTGYCQLGGLYFTNQEHITNYGDYGSQLALVEIPDQARVYVEEEKFKADQLIISRFLSVSEMRQFGLTVCDGSCGQCRDLDQSERDKTGHLVVIDTDPNQRQLAGLRAGRRNDSSQMRELLGF